MNSEEGGEEEEEEEEEEFFESLDRILSSSSCSSASSSDDDGDRQNFFLHRRHSQNRGSRPNSPWTYDFWISEPSSVEDRRRNLLQQLGLVGDSFLSRREQMNLDDRNSDGGEDQATRDNGREDSSSSAMARSRFQDCHSSANFRSLHPSPTNPTGSESATSGSKNNDDPQEQQNTQRDLYCTIKNLDSGEEFVVKELQEDGMWKKLREVGTGRQLTMEEFQSSVVGHSPIVQELMRRQNVEDAAAAGKPAGDYRRNSDLDINELRSKKKGSGWLKSIKIVAGTVVHRIEKRSSDERDTSSEKGGRRSSSATDDSQDAQSHHSPERVKVRHYGKTWKELTDLFLSQEIRAHSGSIWSMKFSLDGRFLASAGEDCIIRIWQVIEIEKKGDLLTAQSGEDGCLNLSHESPETMFLKSNSEGSSCSMNKKRRPKVASGRKSVSFDQIVLPENVFTLSEKPVCSFRGHLQDVLDLSWSKSEHLLSSSMDKTVRLWHISSSSCLKIFSHSDYVTCIQFNPVDDDYFISGSLDAKVRLWSIRGRQVVDWKDVHEMVTAACYTPDGQGALVGSHKGGCHVYDASDNKLHLRAEVDLKNKKKRSHHKITGFQFVPGSSSEVLITSADSRIRVVDGLSLVHKFKGFLNTSSQISASLTSDGKHVVSASEDSHVYIWRYDRSTKGKGGGIATTQSYELFHCRDVSAAVAWPGGAAGSTDATSAWGMVIVTACRGGEIRVFQNFGSPIRV